jgi:hypothetical protein
VPDILGSLPDSHLFVMEYLEPTRFDAWKRELGGGGRLPNPKLLPWGGSR